LPERPRPKPAGSAREKKKLPALQVYARRLCMEIGARPAGSNGERQAADFIEKVMSAGGAEVTVEPFRTEKSAMPLQLVAGLLPLAAVAFFPASAPIAFLLIGLGFLASQLQAYRINALRIFQEKKESANVVSRIEPSEPPDKGAPQVVLLSHYDSPIVSLSTVPYAQELERISSSLGMASLGLLFMLYTVGLAVYVLKAQHGFQDWIWAISLPLVLPSLIAVFLLAERWWWGEPSPGANDNASGTAVLLALQRHYWKTPPLHAEFWFVATGGGAAGSAGVSHLLKEHGRELNRAYFINIEEVGRRKLLCLKREGALLPFLANRRLLDKVKVIAFDQTQYGVEFAGSRVERHEGLKLLSKRKRVLTVTSCPKGRKSRSSRARADDYDRLDIQTLRKAYEFVRVLTESIDKSPKGPRIS